ncbi:hypothetical protein G7047_04960 [Diaphorobacter sp. HDW4A]|uniref:hypothetical protein n=1 Tax=Diaphorobacter sp. HDW4A TaxID=2714924 RepID=UPI001408D550|nr:hypothetical protein [Diaphorobacter sp. HDW4A]QIL79327.1 hypothetical protein G7047_04960 [Diaphorobacter sp. HDW4A]
MAVSTMEGYITEPRLITLRTPATIAGINRPAVEDRLAHVAPGVAASCTRAHKDANSWRTLTCFRHIVRINWPTSLHFRLGHHFSGWSPHKNYCNQLILNGFFHSGI